MPAGCRPERTSSWTRSTTWLVSARASVMSRWNEELPPRCWPTSWPLTQTRHDQSTAPKWRSTRRSCQAAGTSKPRWYQTTGMKSVSPMPERRLSGQNGDVDGVIDPGGVDGPTAMKSRVARVGLEPPGAVQAHPIGTEELRARMFGTRNGHGADPSGGAGRRPAQGSLLASRTAPCAPWSGAGRVERPVAPHELLVVRGHGFGKEGRAPRGDHQHPAVDAGGGAEGVRRDAAPQLELPPGCPCHRAKVPGRLLGALAGHLPLHDDVGANEPARGSVQQPIQDARGRAEGQRGHDPERALGKARCEGSRRPPPGGADAPRGSPDPAGHVPAQRLPRRPAPAPHAAAARA